MSEVSEAWDKVITKLREASELSEQAKGSAQECIEACQECQDSLRMARVNIYQLRIGIEEKVK